MKLKLTADEKKMLRESAAAVREVVGVLDHRVAARIPHRRFTAAEHARQ